MKNIMYSIKYGYAYLICKIVDAILVLSSMANAFMAAHMIKLSAKYGIKTTFAGAILAVTSSPEMFNESVSELISEETAEKLIETYEED